MFRYLALAWDDAQPPARAAAERLSRKLSGDPGAGGRRWRQAVERAGLRVFHAGARAGSSGAHVLHGGAGVVLGRLFAHDAAASEMLDAGETAAIVGSGGRRLIERYWGRYVAVVHDAPGRQTWVLRDPTAGLPCLHLRFQGVEVFFADVEDALALGLGPFSIDMDYVAAHLCYQILESRVSGLREVSRVMGGECVRIGSGGRMERDLYWDPLRVAAVDPLEDAAEAAALLRQAVRRCVQAWAGGHDSIVHTLSGGLDSAIVLACLADAPNRPRITCVNYHSPGANSDERIFARLMADHAGPGTGCALIERERDPSIRLQALLQAPRSAYPVNCRYYLENSAWEAAFTRERQATAIFCGEGGDQLFYQARARFAAGDYLCRRGRARGLGKGLLRVALDAARLDRLSLWTVLGDALGQAWLGRRWDIEQDLRRFRKLAPAGVLARVMGDARIRHPAFQHPPHAIAGGKRWHAYQLLFPAMDFYDPLGSIQDAERITPLSSQPVLELCLRTPVDVLTAGGWDRAVARRAFRQDLPRAIVLRRSKGGLDAYFKRVLLENMDFARPFLLEGQLAAAGLVDRDRLRTALSDTPNRIGANTTELFDCVNLEAWLRRWHGG